MSDLPIEVQALTYLVQRLDTISMADYGIENVEAFPRALDRTDPNGAIGVYYHSWSPRDTPNIGGNEPTIGRYRFAIQAYVKHSERALGEVHAAVLAKRIRLLLYRDGDLQLALRTLREDGEGAVERTLRIGVEQVEYADVPFSGGFAFLSQTEFFIETEVA